MKRLAVLLVLTGCSYTTVRTPTAHMHCVKAHDVSNVHHGQLPKGSEGASGNPYKTTLCDRWVPNR